MQSGPTCRSLPFGDKDHQSSGGNLIAALKQQNASIEVNAYHNPTFACSLRISFASGYYLASQAKFHHVKASPECAPLPAI